MTAVINKSDNASPWRIKRCSKFRRNRDNGWPICGNFTFLIKRLVCSWVCISKLGCFSLIAGSEFIYDKILVFSYARMQKFNLQKNKKKKKKKNCTKKGKRKVRFVLSVVFSFSWKMQLTSIAKTRRWNNEVSIDRRDSNIFQSARYLGKNSTITFTFGAKYVICPVRFNTAFCAAELDCSN